MKTTLFLILLISLLGCKAEWSKEDQSRITESCLADACRRGITNPENHCDCILRKIIDRYPNPNEFENMEMGEYGEIVVECGGEDLSTRIIWPEQTQKAFLDSCKSALKERPDAGQYCHCVLVKLIERYPTNDSLSRINPQIMAEIGQSCATK